MDFDGAELPIAKSLRNGPWPIGHTVDFVWADRHLPVAALGLASLVMESHGLVRPIASLTPLIAPLIAPLMAIRLRRPCYHVPNVP